MKRRNGQFGFTIIEMMVAVLVLAILLGLAVPNMRDMVIRNRVSTQANSIVGALQFARSEAIKRGAPVTVASGSGNTNWQTSGWVVGVDLNNDGDINDVVNGVSEKLRQEPTIAGNTNLTGTAASVLYYPNGSAANFTLTLCTTDVSSGNQRQISVSASGRVQTVKSDNPGCS